MSGPQTAGGELSRAAGHGRPAAPVRLVHLGLGNFYRAHQAWYTDRAPDAGDWGYAAFAGRNPGFTSAMMYDPQTDTLVVGDYGPDAGAADPNRGPEGTVEFNRVPKAANLGWPRWTAIDGLS